MNPAELRQQIPALNTGVYANFGAHGPSPRSVVRSANTWLRTFEFDTPIHDDPYVRAFEEFEETRETVASFIKCSPQEVALTESTTAGISAIANAIDWNQGDVVVRTDVEHPGGILPWERLASTGVTVRSLETTNGRIDLDTYRDAVDDARVVCFSAITWTHGTLLPVQEMVEIAHASDTIVVVDAVQAIGQREVSVSEWGADVVAAASHKWLLGLWGGGILYVNKEAIDQFTPRMIGYRSVKKPTESPFSFKSGASRFEIGSANPAPHIALRTALEHFEAIGMERITSRITQLTNRFVEGIPPEKLCSPSEPESGLVTINVTDPDAVVDRLAAKNMVIRSIPFPRAIRLSIHAVNTVADIDRLLDELQKEW